MISLKVEGMTCGHCVGSVTRAVKQVDPHVRVQVDLAGRTVRVDGSRQPPERFAEAIADAGYKATV